MSGQVSGWHGRLGQYRDYRDCHERFHRPACAESSWLRCPDAEVEAASRSLRDHLDSREGTEHVPSVAALPEKAAEWAPDLCEEIVAEVE